MKKSSQEQAIKAYQEAGLDYNKSMDNLVKQVTPEEKQDLSSLMLENEEHPFLVGLQWFLLGVFATVIVYSLGTLLGDLL